MSVVTTTPGNIRPRLYHAPSSYFSMIARLALAEAGIDHEQVFVDIHFRSGQQLPAYARLNPNMTVPTLVLPGRVLDASRDMGHFFRAIRVGSAFWAVLSLVEQSGQRCVSVPLLSNPEVQVSGIHRPTRRP